MARYAMVHTETGFVANVIEWSGDEADWRPPPDYTMIEDTKQSAGPGGQWDGTNFTPPPPGLPGTRV